MTVSIDMGLTSSGMKATVDLEELLATRLLVQGNSGSGKSHLLRRLIEQSAPWVQQAIIDPEGDFVTLADAFGHLVVDAASHSENALQSIGGRVRQHRVSVVLNLENLDAEMQMRHCAAFLGGLFDADRDYWFPMLVVVDEAQMFAPSAAGEVSDEARKASLGAMTNLMCRGRKRGLAGIIATQRLAKLAKNVAAEASNFLMGRTFLDIDMARAADLLGMERRQAEMFRDLQRGHFIALGPAMARRPLPIRIGDVRTQGRAGSPKLMPMPDMPSLEDARDLIFKAAETPRYSARRVAQPSTVELLQQLTQQQQRPPAPQPEAPAAPVPEVDEDFVGPMPAPAVQTVAEDGAPSAQDQATDAAPLDLFGQAAPAHTLARPAPRTARLSSGDSASKSAVFDAMLREVLADPEAVYRSVAVLYQDFLVCCRGHNINGRTLDMGAFRRKLAAARAGTQDAADDSPEWAAAITLAGSLTEDIQGVFLMLARAALDGQPCPSDAQIARARGSRSPRRGRSILASLEQSGLVEVRENFDGTRVVALPALNWETQAGDPNAPDDEA